MSVLWLDLETTFLTHDPRTFNLFSLVYNMTRRKVLNDTELKNLLGLGHLSSECPQVLRTTWFWWSQVKITVSCLSRWDLKKGKEHTLSQWISFIILALKYLFKQGSQSRLIHNRLQIGLRNERASLANLQVVNPTHVSYKPLLGVKDNNIW